ncbi:hypothetical protein N0V88_002796 [Collariella sp. IMI 366227]|nr:hypothetical protein N0V88_002796 [Collariella sp. IMI 366227]
MRAFTLSLGALALGLASAHEYPNCEPDNCYREMVDPRFADEAIAFCPKFLSGTTTAADAIPTNFENCEGSIKAVSSACSCITYTAGTTEPPATSTSESEVESSTEAPATTTTPPPKTTSEASETETEAETETEEPEQTKTSTTRWTTSTITTTTTRTITSCPPSVTACPSHGTTVTTEVIVTTTVCPVTDEPEEPEETEPVTSKGSSFPPVVTPTEFNTVTVVSTKPPKPSSTGPATGAAGRTVVEGVAAVAGLLAALL